jgi:hypothetical protein
MTFQELGVIIKTDLVFDGLSSNSEKLTLNNNLLLLLALFSEMQKIVFS